MKHLIIVESPTKAKTISKFLSSDYIVESSFGHVRDLPKSKLGIDLEHDFAPQYIIPTKARKHIALLKQKSHGAEEVILATDEDREGEAISWHLAQVLGLNASAARIVFHEITKSAIESALEHPRVINMNLVDAQQARRILDRLVGYTLSPFLWKKVLRGLSAGRVQSVAVRLVVDREREIEKFNPQEYWSIEALLYPEANAAQQFRAYLYSKDGEALEKLSISSQKDAEQIKSSLGSAIWSVAQIERREGKRNPLPPFTTSTLQQDAWRRLRYSAKRTMMLAQNLYERGFITYHRTDSFNIAQTALETARAVIAKAYGEHYWDGPRSFKTKARGAQEAHEAIRPAYPDRIPDKIKDLEPPQRKLYDLIWRRFIASQMAQAVFDATTCDISTGTPYAFRAAGSTLKFDGFLRVYQMKIEENELPALEQNQTLSLKELTGIQHFTQPPARYTEATLIKTLEQHGIGRPSTYAPIISTIEERNYAEKNEQKRFRPTEIGTLVTDLLKEHFPQIVDLEFTARVEEDLDEIADGTKHWPSVLHEFYDPFANLLEQKYKEVQKITPVEETSRVCPQCGKNLLVRTSRFGKFYACSGFPQCRYTAPFNTRTSTLPQLRCPKCVEGLLLEKHTRRGKIFYGCNRYPNCDFAVWDKPRIAGEGEKAYIEKCPLCGNILVEKRKGVVCSNKECGYKE